MKSTLAITCSTFTERSTSFSATVRDRPRPFGVSPSPTRPGSSGFRPARGSRLAGLQSAPCSSSTVSDQGLEWLEQHLLYGKLPRWGEDYGEGGLSGVSSRRSWLIAPLRRVLSLLLEGKHLLPVALHHYLQLTAHLLSGCHPDVSNIHSQAVRTVTPAGASAWAARTSPPVSVSNRV